MTEALRFPEPHEGPITHQAPEIRYDVEGFKSAIEFLGKLEHGANAPWAYLGKKAVVVLQKLTVVRRYLIEPSDQQRIGQPTLSESFLYSFPNGLALGEKIIPTATELDKSIMELCDLLNCPVPRIELPADIRAVLFPPHQGKRVKGLEEDPDDGLVIDPDDTF